jgi:single-strand DNA-binding protein
MPSVNKVILVGHLGSDPELRQTATGQSLCKFRMATTRRWRDQQGTQQEDTCWHNVVAWGKTAEICASYLHKGRQVYVEGRISTRTYDDTKGVRRTWTDVVSQQVLFLGPKHADGSSRLSSSDRGQPTQSSYPAPADQTSAYPEPAYPEPAYRESTYSESRSTHPGPTSAYPEAARPPDASARGQPSQVMPHVEPSPSEPPPRQHELQDEEIPF